VCLSVIVNTRQWGGLRQRQLLHHSKNKIAVFSSDRQTTAEAEEHDVQQSVWWAAREHKYGILLCGQNKQHVGRVVTAMLWKIQTKHQIHFLVKVCNPKTCMRFTVVSAVNILQAGSSTFLRNSRSHPQNFQMPYSLIPYVKMLYIYIYIYTYTVTLCNKLHLFPFNVSAVQATLSGPPAAELHLTGLWQSPFQLMWSDQLIEISSRVVTGRADCSHNSLLQLAEPLRCCLRIATLLIHGALMLPFRHSLCTA